MYTICASAAIKYPRFSKLEMPVVSSCNGIEETMRHSEFFVESLHLRRDVFIRVFSTA